MLSISHSLTGAFIASKIPDPIIYTPLSLAAHYLEDWIPHWDVGTGIRSGKRKKITAFVFEIFDISLSILLIYLLFGLNIHAWLGALICLLPDFLEAPKTFFKINLLPKLSDFHTFMHTSTPNMFWGLLPQILLLIIIFVLR